MEKNKDITSPPGLRRQNGRLLWRATKVAVERGYPVKSVNLTKLQNDPRKLFDRCVRLQREQDEWLRDGRPETVIYDGTFGTLLKMYETNPKSSFFQLKPGSLHPYKVYLRMLYSQIAHCQVDKTSGLDLQDWFKSWTAPGSDGKRTVAKARMAMCVIRAAVRFGVLARLPGVDQFAAIFSVTKMKFEMVRPRQSYATADEVVQLRAAAHQLGQPRAAFAYALQFESTLRQWDVRGQWVDLNDKRPSAIIDRGQKWVGPTWSDIDRNLILRWRPSKTDGTTGVEVVHDLKIYPMVMEELQHIPVEQRYGPLVIDMRRGRPHRDQTWLRLWRDVCELVPGVDPYKLWNRDLRASGVTEAKSGDAPAQTDDLRKGMGHSPTSQTAGTVYDRAKLDAMRRVAQARQQFRNADKNGQ